MKLKEKEERFQELQRLAEENFLKQADWDVNNHLCKGDSEEYDRLKEQLGY